MTPTLSLMWRRPWGDVPLTHESTWYHGRSSRHEPLVPLKPGELVPSTHSAEFGECVFITPSQTTAIIYSCVGKRQAGFVYRVRPIGFLVADPYPNGSDEQYVCQSAEVMQNVTDGEWEATQFIDPKYLEAARLMGIKPVSCGSIRQLQQTLMKGQS